MYESFYGLKWRPFAAAPDPASFVALADLRPKHAALKACVESGQGIGILTAPAGMGKTLVLRKLMGELRDTFANVFLANAHFPSRRGLLQAILYELGQPYTNMDEQELRLALTSTLRGMRSRRKAVLLAVDEAHLLDDELLDEVRAVTNYVEDGEPLVRVLMSGQLLLEEKLASPSLQSLNERVGCQVTLEPFSRQDSAEYMKLRLRWAGAQIEKLFSPDAVQAVCEIADGVPRCINHLCDHSLMLGYIAETKPVPRKIILEALENLRQLPLSWNEPLVPEIAHPDPAPSQSRPVFRSPAAEFGASLGEGVASIEVGSGEPDGSNPWLCSSDDSFEAVEIGGEVLAADSSEDAVLELPPDAEIDSDDDASHTEFNWRKLSRPSLELPDEPVDVADAFDCGDDEATVSCSPSTPCEDDCDYEEEVVVDRYASLDAGRERTARSPFRGSRPSPTQLIDDVEPMIEDVLRTTWNDEHPQEAATDASRAEPTFRYYENEDDRIAEERIGASVLETCLETHEAIFGPVVSPDEAAETPAIENRAAPLHPADEYDVVQPETDGPAAPPEAPPQDSAEKPGKTNSQQLPNRQCQQLFTELRRRRNS